MQINLNNYVIYIHMSPSRKYYVGITKRKPKYRWRNGDGYKSNDHFYRAINKYGWDNFIHIILANNLSEFKAKEYEKLLILRYKSNDPIFGYNKSSGGEGASGCVRSNEFKKNISEKNSGKNNYWYGKTLSEPHKEKLRNAKINKKLSDEHKRKIGISGKNRGNIQVICITTNIIFKSISEASKTYNVSASDIVRCCKHKIGVKSAGKHPETGEKLVWMYYEEYLYMIRGDFN